MKHVFIIGSKGIPANYGGFETFVEHLTRNKQSDELFYHVACLTEKREEFLYQGARCFGVTVPNVGAAKAVLYDIRSFFACLSYIRQNRLDPDYKEPIVYVLACRIGPVTHFLTYLLHKKGGKLYVNPDGHEWMRGKWNKLVQRYWKYSEKHMIKHADVVVCDSKNMQTYIQQEYPMFDPVTKFIAYGAQVKESTLSEDSQELQEFYEQNGIKKYAYYLIVGRFVPENNYECMIREFMASDTHKKLVLICNVERNDFFRRLKQTTGFDQDKRICFAGTVYKEELLKKIRENAWAYLHGHEVGGTNPSLLEALVSTQVNLLLDVGFNREVGEDACYYWNKEPGNLAHLLTKIDASSDEEREALSIAAKETISSRYSHQQITSAYEELFLS